ncbi:MAG: helix-turn-helix transcriptional regulator [Ruminococcus sp.]|nr:helix-turn-helix transcriptional regulator [Ruminococcus sp.]
MSRIFGIRLYYLRKHKTTYSQTQIAKLLHLERSTYTKYECGVTKPSIQTLRKLKELFGVSYDELLDEELNETEIIDYDLFR